jgi:hypothetical protein
MLVLVVAVVVVALTIYWFSREAVDVVPLPPAKAKPPPAVKAKAPSVRSYVEAPAPAKEESPPFEAAPDLHLALSDSVLSGREFSFFFLFVSFFFA